MSLQTLKRLVKKMIDEEDGAKPFTDEQIAKKLDEAGIHVTRTHCGKIPRRYENPEHASAPGEELNFCRTPSTNRVRSSGREILADNSSFSPAFPVPGKAPSSKRLRIWDFIASIICRSN